MRSDWFSASASISACLLTSIALGARVRPMCARIVPFAIACLLSAPAVAQTDPGTLWHFVQEYSAPDKGQRFLNSFAVADVSGCTGTLISPHIVMTAAHCSGPDRASRSVRFFRIDEDSPNPGTQSQSLSPIYQARSLPWQSFISSDGVQVNDLMLWWLPDDPTGVPPGIRYGYIDVGTGAPKVGRRAYSFWVNPYQGTDFSVTANTILHSAGLATSLGVHQDDNTGPEHFTDYSITSAPGASGSAVIHASTHEAIGVTAIATPNWRRAGDTRFSVSEFDADSNGVLDAVEYDLLWTGMPRSFYLLGFDSALERAQWRPWPGANGGIEAVRVPNPNLPANLRPRTWVGHVGGRLWGPVWYRARWNSSWVPSGPLPTGYVLENFEDGNLDSRVTASAGAVIGPSPVTDSVDNDDGTLDHSGTAGSSFFSSSGPAGIKFSFNRTQIGSLPQRAGIVWTDGAGETTFEAFDAGGNSLGVVGPIAIADDSYSGTTGDDRFFGATHQGGISALHIRNSVGGIEVDHVQFGGVPPLAIGETLWHATARFAAGDTYRVMATVYGIAPDPNGGFIKFQSDSGAQAQIIPFQPTPNKWSTVIGRVTLGNAPDYRLVIGAPGKASFYVRRIAIIRESAIYDLQTHDQRRGWRYFRSSYPTSWGIDGAGDFSAVVVSPSNPLTWALNLPYLALQPNTSYKISFDVQHVSGPLIVDQYMNVLIPTKPFQPLAGEVTWRFGQPGERSRKRLRVDIGTNTENYVLTFGSRGVARYMVDNVQVSPLP